MRRVEGLHPGEGLSNVFIGLIVVALACPLSYLFSGTDIGSNGNGNKWRDVLDPLEEKR